MAQQVKDLASSHLWLWLQLWFGFDPWPRTSPCPRNAPPKKNESWGGELAVTRKRLDLESVDLKHGSKHEAGGARLAPLGSMPCRTRAGKTLRAFQQLCQEAHLPRRPLSKEIGVSKYTQTKKGHSFYVPKELSKISWGSAYVHPESCSSLAELRLNGQARRLIRYSHSFSQRNPDKDG